jgi:hypothetical protein
VEVLKSGKPKNSHESPREILGFFVGESLGTDP